MSRGQQDLIRILGLDPDDLDWQSIAMCQDMPLEDFFDAYESNPGTARVTDQACLSCPVIAQCLKAGTDNKEYGVWGGVFLDAGKPDPNKNAHKSPEVWEEMRQRVKDSL